MEDVIRELADKRALDELICAQSNAADSQDWEALRKCFADEVDIILSEAMGHTTDPDEFVRNGQNLVPGFDSMMHTITNFVHHISGDTASSRAYVQATHFLKNDICEPELRGGAIYLFDSVRTADGWKLKKMRLQHIYNVGNPMLYGLAMERVRAGKVG